MRSLGKVLVVDDVEAIREIVKFYIESVGEVQFLEAENGQKAIELLKANPDLKLVFCDYNMHPGNGGEVAVALRQQAGQLGRIPFVLHTSETVEDHHEFAGLENIYHAEKPLTLDQLENLVEEIFPATSSTPRINYLPVHLGLLSLMRKTYAPLFVKMGETKYVRFLHEGVDMTAEEIHKLHARGVKQLYVERSRFDAFISDFQKFVAEQLDVNKALASGASLQTVVTESMDMVSMVTEALGISAEVQALTEQNIQLVLKLANTNEKLVPIMERFEKMEGSPYTQHCVMTAMIATDLGKKLMWVNDKSSVKFAYAALVHDFSTSADKWTPTGEADEREHPRRAHEFVKNWKNCPADVETIILQHHELPNGRGYPKHLEASKIHPMAALFIVAHHVAVSMLLNKGKINIPEWVEQNRDLYSSHEFNRIVTQLLPQAETATLSAKKVS